MDKQVQRSISFQILFLRDINDLKVAAARFAVTVTQIPNKVPHTPCSQSQTQIVHYIDIHLEMQCNPTLQNKRDKQVQRGIVQLLIRSNKNRLVSALFKQKSVSFLFVIFRCELVHPFCSLEYNCTVLKVNFIMKFLSIFICHSFIVYCYSIISFHIFYMSPLLLLYSQHDTYIRW